MTETQTPTKESRVKHSNEEYAGVGTPTLRAWMRYWQRVESGDREPNEGDEANAARSEVAKLRKEIEARGKKA